MKNLYNFTINRDRSYKKLRNKGSQSSTPSDILVDNLIPNSVY